MAVSRVKSTDMSLWLIQAGCHLYRTVQYSLIVTLRLLFYGRSDKTLYNVFNSSYSLECYFG